MEEGGISYAQIQFLPVYKSKITQKKGSVFWINQKKDVPFEAQIWEDVGEEKYGVEHTRIVLLSLHIQSDIWALLFTFPVVLKDLGKVGAVLWWCLKYCSMM